MKDKNTMNKRSSSTFLISLFKELKYNTFKANIININYH